MLFAEVLLLAVLLTTTLFVGIWLARFLGTKWFFHRVNAQRCPKCGTIYRITKRETLVEAIAGPNAMIDFDPAPSADYVITCVACGSKTMVTLMGRLAGRFQPEDWGSLR